MIPVSKVPKQSVSSAAMERRKRDREKERSKVPSKKKLPPDAKSRFGKEFLSKLCELFQSDEPDSYEKMHAMHDELAAYYKEHNLNFMWISDDETETKDVKAPLSKKMHQDVKKGDIRCISRPKFENKEKAKPRPDPKNAAVASTSVPSSSLLSQFELSDDSDDNTSRKSSITFNRNYKLCDTCSSATSVPNNMILECEECGKTVHQKCACPEITPLQAKDPRFLFVCSDCRDREDEKAGPSCSKSSSSSFRKDDRSGMQKSSEERIQPLKTDNDILVTFSNFAAKKAKKLSASGGSSLPGSNVTLNKMLPSFGGKDRK